MLKVIDISKRFGKRKILNSVSLNFKKGEITGILGPNGAGKTTLLNIIMGFVKEDKGEVIINNKSINKLPVYKRVREGLSYLTQDISVIEELTVKNNIVAMIQLIEKKIKVSDDEINDKLIEFSITRLAKQKTSTLSGGERRKVEIILSLLTKPSYILFDEPFTGLDPKTISELHHLILSLKKKNIGVIIVDHNYNEVMNKSDKLYLLFEGKIYYEGNASEFSNNEDVRKYYLGY